MKTLTRAILDGGLTVRPVTPEDVDRVLRYRIRNQVAFRPFEPRQRADYYTRAQVESYLEASLADQARDRRYSFVIVAGKAPEDDLAGHVNLNNVVRGAFQSTHIGYATDARFWGRGIMTAAVGAVVGMAFGELQLHRVEAAILPDNAASMAVVRKNGFSEEGLARFYLAIDGQWRDHRIFARTDPSRLVP
jgi:ribosomal-protein-alanine N-acetyltransferase